VDTKRFIITPDNHSRDCTYIIIYLSFVNDKKSDK